MFDPIIMGRLSRLEDGGGYSEDGKVLLNTALERENTISITVVTHHIGLELGKKYTVTLDSGTYEVECISAGENLGLTDPDYFIVQEVVEDGLKITFAEDFNCGNHITISETETIHPIDPKYLPGVCLPVVELSTVPTADGAALTAEETAQLSSALATSKYALVVLPFDFAISPMVCRFYEEDESAGFLGGVVAHGSFVNVALIYADGVGIAAVSSGTE